MQHHLGSRAAGDQDLGAWDLIFPRKFSHGKIHGTTPEMHGGCHGFDEFDGWENHRTLGWNWMDKNSGGLTD